MLKLLISLSIGVIAGIIDVIPMIMRKLDKYANWSAFAHWVVLGLFITYIELPLEPWLKGFVVAELGIIPVLIIVAKEDKKSIIPITTMSAILGILVGIASAKFTV